MEELLPQVLHHGLPRWLSVKESACQCRRPGFNPWVGKIPWRRKWNPTSVFLPGRGGGKKKIYIYICVCVCVYVSVYVCLCACVLSHLLSHV